MIALEIAFNASWYLTGIAIAVAITSVVLVFAFAMCVKIWVDR